MAAAGRNHPMARSVVVKPGKHWGWWIEGRKSKGGLFMYVWWPTEAFARRIAGWFE
jgi:hypothetical protein